MWVADLNSNNFDNRLNVNTNNSEDFDNRFSFGIIFFSRIFNMKTYKNLYSRIYSLDNLIIAWKKARKGKTKKIYVKKFEENFYENILILHKELKYKMYSPKPLKTFILRDPKTRKISKSHFRDRIVHHALCNIIEPLFDKTFIYDSCANRKCKGNLFAIQRFDKFKRKISKNGKINGWFNNNQVKGYCLKADIKHYFEEVDLKILIKIIKRKLSDKWVIWLIKKILNNDEVSNQIKKGMPLGNLTSQFFANVYLNELDYFIKHELKVKYYIRYVDDFVILCSSKSQLKIWKGQIEEFLQLHLKLELHSDKSRIISLSRGIDFVGFRNFYYHKLLRKRNIKNIESKIREFRNEEISKEKILESFQGWNAYAKWGNTFRLRRKIVRKIYIT
jgi:RNA-directed DNA polymerase